MLIKRFGYSFLWIVVAALALNVIRLRKMEVHAASQAVVPYTVLLKEIARNKDGSAPPAHFYTYAVRSDGSYVSKVDGPQGSATEKEIRIIEFSAKVHVELRDLWELKSSKAGKGPLLRNSASQCVYPNIEESFVAEQNIGGFRSAEVSKSGRTSWYALDHGCALVQERMVWGDGGVSEKTLIGLIAGEPDASLFAVPDSFREVPPSQVALGPGAAGRPEAARYQPLDRSYRENRPSAEALATILARSKQIPCSTCQQSH